jgi:hypothetical protein
VSKATNPEIGNHLDKKIHLVLLLPS